MSRRQVLTALALSPALGWPGLLFAKPFPLRADRVRFLGMTASATGVLLAVGERGVIARRDGQSQAWSLQRLATRETLTACVVREDGVALAVGHGGAAFRSEDAGKTWQSLAQALDLVNSNRDPWLGAALSRRGGLWLMGAFGLLAGSDDGGKTWTRLTPMEAEFDRHLYGMTEVLEGGYLLLGESGTLADSFNGRDWRALRSPYDGSWFGAMQTTAGTLIAYGMRGQVYRRTAGQSGWVAAEGIQSTNGWVAGTQLQNGHLVLVGGQGLVAVSQDDGRRFQVRQVWEGSLSGVAQDAQSLIWLAGTQGLKGFDTAWKAVA